MDFYEQVQIPLNYEADENGYEFANAVTVADKFAESTAINAVLSKQTEDASKRLASAEFELEQAKRSLAKMRRTIFAEHYSKVRSSAKPEVLDAFVVVHAGELLPELQELENQEHECWLERTAAQADLDVCKGRMRTLERTVSYLTEWLNYDKFRHRLNDARVRGEI